MDAGLRSWEHWRLPARTARADAEYFRFRTAQEQRAALRSHDARVRRVHLEMAVRYRALSHEAETHGGVELRLVL